MKYIIYQPGNGTRYEVFMEKIDDKNMARSMGISSGGWFVAHMMGHSYAFQPNGFLDVGYVESRLFRSQGKDWADAEAMTQLLGMVMGRPIRSIWKHCKHCGHPIHPDQNEIMLCAGCEYLLRNKVVVPLPKPKGDE